MFGRRRLGFSNNAQPWREEGMEWDDHEEEEEEDEDDDGGEDEDKDGLN